MVTKFCVMKTWSSITKAKFQVLSFIFLISFLSPLIILSNDVKLNLVLTKDNSKHSFSIARWNLSSIAAENFVELSQLEITIHYIAIILFACLRHGYTLQPPYIPMTCFWRIKTYIVLKILTMLPKE